MRLKYVPISELTVGNTVLIGDPPEQKAIIAIEPIGAWSLVLFMNEIYPVMLMSTQPIQCMVEDHEF